MLNSRKRSDSSIFCINAKTCTTRNLHEVLQARQYQRMISKLPGWSFFILIPSHRTLFWIRWCMSGQTRTAQSVFGRLAANRRMHGIENAALFNVPAHEIPSSVICHLIINYSFLPLLVKGISSCYDINQLKIVNFVCINVIKNDYRKEVMTWNSSMNW